jgi:hypothetical protein
MTANLRTFARLWFDHNQDENDYEHDDLHEVVAALPLTEFDLAVLDPLDRAAYDYLPLVRAFVFKEIHGWKYETALGTYLAEHPGFSESLGFDSMPDQSTLWRTWHERFSEDIRETIENVGRSLLYKAAEAGVETPRDLPNEAGAEETSRLTQREILDRAGTITTQAKRLVFPAFGFERAKNRQIHENAFWELQTYAGLREDVAVNEGARSFLADSTREVTPLGHVHRHHIRQLSIDDIRAMYHEAIGRVIDEAAQTSAFHRYATVAIDTTEEDPFTGDREGHEAEIIGTKEDSDEYAYQWATIQVVGKHPPVMLDALPVLKGVGPTEYVPELLDMAQDLINIDLVLMDREFDSQHILEPVVNRGLDYVAPKRKYTSEKAKAKQLEQRGADELIKERGLHLGDNEWHETTLIYKRKDDWDGELKKGHERYAVFMTSVSEPTSALVDWYGDRGDIESGYKSLKRFMTATTSKDLVLRFFYFAFACLLYSIWRLVDLLVQLDLFEEYDRAPLVTANDVLTFAKKRTGIG